MQFGDGEGGEGREKRSEVRRGTTVMVIGAGCRLLGFGVDSWWVWRRKSDSRPLLSGILASIAMDHLSRLGVDLLRGFINKYGAPVPRGAVDKPTRLINRQPGSGAYGNRRKSSGRGSRLGGVTSIRERYNCNGSPASCRSWRVNSYMSWINWASQGRWMTLRRANIRCWVAIITSAGSSVTCPKRRA